MRISAPVGAELVPHAAPEVWDPFVIHLLTLLDRGEFRAALTDSRARQQDIFATHGLHNYGHLLAVQVRALTELGHSEEALAVSDELLGICRSQGWSVEEIKALADSASTLIKLGRTREAIDRLGRAVWLLSRCRPQGERYVQAVLALAYAIQDADLYEAAADILAGLLEDLAGLLQPLVTRKPLQLYYVEDVYADLLLVWGMRLEQLGRDEEAASRYGRALRLVEGWIGVEGTDTVTPVMQALALAKLGRYDEALAVAVPLLETLRNADNRRRIGVCHLALGVSYRGLGDYVSAKRELNAAEYMWGEVGSPADRQLLEHERVVLALATEPLPVTTGRLIEQALRRATERVWNTRLHGLASLRQAAHREQVDSERGDVNRQLFQDALTLLGNRRLFEQLLAAVAMTPARRPLSLVLIDVDRFKSINDTHSHLVGDHVLRDVATVVRAQIRPVDVAVRLGGDEFALFLQLPLGAAMAVADRIRSQVAQTQWELVSPGLQVTISAGVAERGEDDDGAALFGAADSRLYQAKRRGRNRACA